MRKERNEALAIMEGKPIKPKPQFYTVVLGELQSIARLKGYNLIIHGSMNRDIDLIAVAWSDDPAPHYEVLKGMAEYLGQKPMPERIEEFYPSVLPGNRTAYVINLNRGGEYNDYQDAQWYLDISFTPYNKLKQEEKK